MAETAPKKVTIRSYQVGFGDCFLLTFHYKSDQRHILIDFGSTGQPKNAGDQLMLRVANDIKATCGGKLHAIVATHRHKDHISGFSTNSKQTASGDIIASCKPEVIVQPWTEHPKAKVDASAAPSDQTGVKGFVAALQSMHDISQAILVEAERRKGFLGQALYRQLAFLGEDNLSNLSAVQNLMDMGKSHFYLHYGSRSGLERVLPGVKVSVLGPPDLKQSEEIRVQRSRDENEFWHFQALANQFAAGSTSKLFRNADAYPSAAGPAYAKWFVKRMRAMRGEQLLGIVRQLDKVMNNTSLILLFEVNGKKLLFPGDAQIENWSYALSKPAIRKKLQGVNVYKVGHHGSLNATPKTLWNGFEHRSKKEDAPDRLTTVVSTMAGKHGTPPKTEVPRKPLVDALKAESNYHTTQDVKKKDLFFDVEFQF